MCKMHTQRRCHFYIEYLSYCYLNNYRILRYIKMTHIKLSKRSFDIFCHTFSKFVRLAICGR